jgi:hypothetical protein
MSLFRVVTQELLNEFFGLFVIDKLGELKLTLHNFLINVIRSLSRIAKGQDPTQKLIQADTERPKINQVIVPLTQNDIGRHVMRGANDGEGLADLVVFGSNEFCCGHVDEFHVPFGVDHEVLWFDVTADDLVVVEVLQNEDDARTVELAVFSGEQADLAHDLVKVLPAHVLLQVKKTVLCLESLAQLKQEGKCNRA